MQQFIVDPQDESPNAPCIHIFLGERTQAKRMAVMKMAESGGFDEKLAARQKLKKERKQYKQETKAVAHGPDEGQEGKEKQSRKRNHVRSPHKETLSKSEGCSATVTPGSKMPGTKGANKTGKLIEDTSTKRKPSTSALPKKRRRHNST